MKNSKWRFLADFVALFKHEERGPIIVKVLLFFSICEFGLIYYVVYQPDIYLRSFSRLVAPIIVWVIPPLMCVMIFQGVWKLKKDIEREVDDSE